MFQLPAIVGKIKVFVYSLLLECMSASNKFMGMCKSVSCFGTSATNQNNILFTHQQMHFLLNLEKFKFILKYT